MTVLVLLLRWIGRYHEHEPLLEDLEEEKLSKEEQTQAWESFQYEEAVPQNLAPSTPGVLPPHMFPHPALMQHNPIPAPFPPVQSSSLPPSHVAPYSLPSHVTKNCQVETHVRQLQAEHVKAGTSTVCGLCNQIISWETIKRS